MVVPLIVAGVASLALEYGPSLARWIAGDTTGDVLESASQVIRSVTGTDSIADAAAVLSSDPSKAGELRLQLAQIAATREAAHEQAQLETYKAALADTANARAMTQTPLIAKTQVGLSIYVMFLLGLVIVMLFFVGPPPGTETMLNILLGALIGYCGGVKDFFLGNSTSGHSANNAMAATFTQRQAPVAAAPVQINQPTGTVNTGGSVPVAVPAQDEAPRTTDALNDESYLKARGG